MSYRATLNGEVFFNTNSSSQFFGLISAKLQLKAGAAGLFSFSVPNCNAAYDRFRLISDYIDVYRNGEIIFSGRVSSVSMNFDTTMQVEAEGLLSILNDTVFRPITHEGTFLELVGAIIASHNSQVEQEKRLVIGNISVPDGACYRAYENYESTFSRIQDLVDSFGGYPSIRRSSSGNLIFDWLYNISTHASQKIELGENLISINKSSNSDNIITVLIPLGAEIEDEETGERSRTTIASVNDGKDYIELEHAENKIVGVYTWDDITEPSNLLRTGERWLEQQSMLHTTVNVTNVDLANTGENVGNFRICTLVDVTSRPHGLNEQSFECLGLELNLLSPDDDKMTLGIVLDGFSIKAQKEAKLNAIILEKINADYATNERLNAIRRAIGTTLETYSTAINQNSESITLLATHVTEETARIDNDILNAKGATITGSTMHYLATSAGSGVTRETTGWTTGIQQMTATNKYLWTYVTYTYGSGATRDTDPVITGTYGEKGEKGDTGATGAKGATGDNGVSITNVVPLYYAKNNATKPAKPTSEKTSPSTEPDDWRTQIPTLTDTYKYMFTCNQVYYSDGSLTWSDVTYDQISTTAVDVQRRMTTAETSINQNSDNITLLASRVETKRAVFQSVPVPPYDEGDLWYRGLSDDGASSVPGIAIPGESSPGVGGDIYICIVGRASEESFNAGDWEPTFAGKFEDLRAIATDAKIEIDSAKALIDLKVSKTDYNAAEIALMINEAGSSIKLNADHIDLNGVVTANTYFRINTDGSMVATAGEIGGFEIDSSSIHTKDVPVTSRNSGSVALSSKNFTRLIDTSRDITATIYSTEITNLRLAIGQKFGVTATGAMYADAATIGSIDISGWKLDGNGLVQNNYVFGQYTISTRYGSRASTAYSLTINSTAASGSGASNAYFNISALGDRVAGTGPWFCYGTMAAGSYSNTSDIRLKTDVHSLNVNDSIQFLKALNPIQFRFKDKPGILRHGLIAQEVEKALNSVNSNWGIIGEVVTGLEENHDTYKTVSYVELIPDLIAAFKYQQEIIESLSNRLQVLEGGNQ